MTPHPQRCKYLVNVGMYAQCQDSYCPARMQGCDHIIKPSCWGIASSEQEILEEMFKKICKQCPVKEEIHTDDKQCAESCEGCLVRSVYLEDLRSKQGEP